MKALSALLILGGLGILAILHNSDPLIRLIAASLGLLFFVKLAALSWQLSEGLKPQSKLGLMIFLFLWPGVKYSGFETRKTAPPETGRHFLESWLFFLGGCAVLLISAYFGRGESVYFNYLALFSILSIIHMGSLEALTDGLRLLGFSPQSLFDRPRLSESLKDFWSHRWNRAFVDMNKLFILQPLKGKVGSGFLVFFIFLVSGLLHELAISYPAGGPWGLPLLYFCFQGLGVLIQKKHRWPRSLVLSWILLPVPVLFPPAFVNLFLGGLCSAIYAQILTLPIEDLLRYGFLCGAAMHGLVLCASVQVPGELGWREEFQRLRSLNRKVFWTYGAYIFTIIVFMAAVSVHLSGITIYTQSDLIWATFIALFWWARIGIDFLYMKHEDWPKGPRFVVGHICLSTLFLTMTLIYSGLAIEIAKRV